MPSHTNRLANETSLYLLQHAHNPVDWYPWGEEALAAAKTADKPILVSIGYAACHWCHVMERESFENEDTAEVMNEHFINIKIDREERPDLDHIYMDAVQAIAGNGGWPLNVFLTPDARPFYGGTYFPPQKAYGRNSWTDVLLSISNAWENRRSEIEEQAGQLITHIKRSNNFSGIKGLESEKDASTFFSEGNCNIIAENLLKNADTQDGGFGAAPKFPQTFSIQYLLQHFHFYGHEPSLQQAELSLQKMINGGINDQLAGGFARYSTDAQWLAPHFEKMLYDNALLVIVLCDAYQLTKAAMYSDAIRKTLSFITAEMQHENGGYYAAIDADSEGVEGKFYVWQKKEIEQLLGDDATLFCSYYNVTEKGNWEHSNILNITTPLSETAAALGISEAAAQQKITVANEILRKERNKRVRPATDDKILFGWNALLLSAFCKAAAALREDSYRLAAIDLFNFMEEAFSDKEHGGYMHTYKNGQAKFHAFLDDYAWYIQACIQLQEITSTQQYLEKAKWLTQYVQLHFSDMESGFFFFTPDGQQDVVVRKVELYDGATPSANAVMAHNLLHLGLMFDERTWYDKGTSMLLGIGEAIKKYPGSFGVWATAVQNLTNGINEIVVTGEGMETLRDDILQEFIPGRVLQGSQYYINMVLFEGKTFSPDAFVYLCRNQACAQPVKTTEELMMLLKNKSA